MAPKRKLDDGSKPAVIRITRSHTRTDGSENASIDIRVGSVTKVEVNEKRDVVGRKRKADLANLDAPDTRNGSDLKKTVKKTKKKEIEPLTFINPFIPEPSLTVAEHEAHSRALSQIPHVVIPSNASADGKSLFSKSLASDVSNQEAIAAPLKPLATAPNPRSKTPARPLLILAPLPTSKPKSVTRNAPVPTPARRRFLAPSSANTSSPTPMSTHFSTPLSSSSTQVVPGPLAQAQTPLLNKSAVSQKTSKIVTDKISVLEA
jgi:hypothetical protein